MNPTQTLNMPNQVTTIYNKTKSQYSEIFKRYIELQEERRQNSLVLNNIQLLEGDNRRCWKVLGGVLVEHTLIETITSLKQNILMLEQTLKALDEEMAKRQKQILELQLKYNLNPNKQNSQQMGTQNKSSGLLA